MITPAGSECKHYYEDFNRGRAIQQCRLARLNPEPRAWKPADCARCRGPAILRANGNPDMVLTLTIRSGFLGLGRRLEIQAVCGKHKINIPEPPIGCPMCNAERPNLKSLFGEPDS